MKKPQKETVSDTQTLRDSLMSAESVLVTYTLGPSLHTEDLAERVAIKVDSGIHENEAIAQTRSGR